MFLKTHRIFKDGKRHIYYSLCESLRVSRKRVLQRQVLHLGELNTTQLESWQRTIEVVEEDGRRHQMRLFTDRHKEVVAAAAPGDVAEVVLSSLVVRRPRQFGACSRWMQVMGRARAGRVLAAGIGGGSRRGAMGESRGAFGRQSAYCAAQRAIHSRKVVPSDGHGGLAG